MFAWVIPVLTLTALEIVLGINNIIFMALVAGRLPTGQQAMASRLGLALAQIVVLDIIFSLDSVITVIGMAPRRHPGRGCHAAGAASGSERWDGATNRCTVGVAGGRRPAAFGSAAPRGDGKFWPRGARGHRPT
jgi:hypothetical protein